MSAPVVPDAKVAALIAHVDVKAFEPILRGAADDLYERLLTTVQDYLIDNLDHNLKADISQARATVHYYERQLAEISDALGVSAYSQEARMGRIQTLLEKVSA